MYGVFVGFGKNSQNDVLPGVFHEIACVRASHVPFPLIVELRPVVQVAGIDGAVLAEPVSGQSRRDGVQWPGNSLSDWEQEVR